VVEETEAVVLEIFEDSMVVWKVYGIVRQYLKPVFAGMGGLVSEEVDTTMLFELCKVMKLGKKKVLEIVELLPYLHNTVLSRKLKREAESGRPKEEADN
jgi:hypothetical protein